MPNDSEPTESIFGFLAVVEEPSVGMVGGLLLIDHRGRPLEFHCTTPVLPSRADEILCGATLRSLFYCERLGKALLAKAAKSSALLLVNHLDLWPIAEETSSPVVLVKTEQLEGTDSTDTSARSLACLDRLPPETRHQVELLVGELENHVDLHEPFDRVEEAIRETGLLAKEEESSDSEGEEPYDLAA